MKIILPTFEYAPFKGGIAVYLEQLVGELQKHHDVTVVTERFKNSFLFDQKQTTKIIRTNFLFSFGIFRWLKIYFFLQKLQKSENFDHMIISHIVPMGYVSMLLGIPYTVILHGTDARLTLKSPLKKVLLRMILKRSTQVLVNSKYTRSLIENYCDDKTKIVLAYPSPKSLPLVSGHKDIHEGLRLISVNRLVPRKGNDTTLEALKLLKEKGVTDITYTIIGSGYYEKSLRELITTYKLEDQVTILTNVSDDELAHLYASHDLYVMPARVTNDADVEGFGIAYLEASLYGLPSIAGHLGGAPEAVLEGVTGVVVNALHAHEVAQAIMYFYAQPELLSSMGSDAQHRTVSTFTPSQQFHDYLITLSHYEKI